MYRQYNYAGPRGFEPPDYRLRRPVLMIAKFHIIYLIHETLLYGLIILSIQIVYNYLNMIRRSIFFFFLYSFSHISLYFLGKYSLYLSFSRTIYLLSAKTLSICFMDSGRNIITSIFLLPSYNFFHMSLYSMGRYTLKYRTDSLITDLSFTSTLSSIARYDRDIVSATKRRSEIFKNLRTSSHRVRYVIL